MGNDSSKKKYRPTISDEKKNSIANFLKSVSPNVKEISAANLQTAWRDKLSDGLQRAFISYLFRGRSCIGLEELEMLYYGLVEGAWEERAKLTAAILGSDDQVTRDALLTYVSDVVESYVLAVKCRHSKAWASWTTDDPEQAADVTAIAHYCTKDIKTEHHHMVTVFELENWLRESSFLKELSESVINVALAVDMECLKPALPVASAPSRLLRIPVVGLLSHLTRSEAQVWRLLYSSASEPHSWQIFQSKLFGEGPTVVLLQDQAGAVFGGYASTSWKLTPTFYGDENCFLLRLRPELRVCFPTGYNHNFQYINSGASTLPNGLGMGGQLNYFGFFLSSEFGPGSVAKSCTTFRDYLPLASAPDFTFSHLEVWAVGERDPVEEGVRQLGGGLSMSRDPGAVAILELVGKGGHAKAAGELPQDLDS